MKTKLALLAALLGGAVASLQAAPFETASPTVTASVGYTSDYVFRGIKEASSALTAGAAANFTNVYVGVYNITPFQSSPQSVQTDLYVGYKHDITQALSYDVGVTAYWFPHDDTGAKKYSFEGYLGLTQKIMTNWSASAYAYYDVNRQTYTLEGSSGYALPITQRLSLSLSGFLGTVHGDEVFPVIYGRDVHDSYSYYGFTVAVPFKLTHSLTLIAGVQYSDTINLRGGLDGGDLLYGFGRLTYTF